MCLHLDNNEKLIILTAIFSVDVIGFVEIFLYFMY